MNTHFTFPSVIKVANARLAYDGLPLLIASSMYWRRWRSSGNTISNALEYVDGSSSGGSYCFSSKELVYPLDPKRVSSVDFRSLVAGLTTIDSLSEITNHRAVGLSSNRQVRPGMKPKSSLHSSSFMSAIDERITVDDRHQAAPPVKFILRSAKQHDYLPQTRTVRIRREYFALPSSPRKHQSPDCK